MVFRKRLMKKHAGIIIISLILTAVAVMQAEADEVYTYQQGMEDYNGCVDECIHASGYLSDTRLRMKASSASGEEYNTLIRFEGIEEDLAGKVVAAASLILTFRYENIAWAPATIDVYPCLKWWDEPDWIHAEPFADPCVAWDIAGAQQPDEDRGGLILDPCSMGDRYVLSIYNYKNYDDGEQFEFPLDAALVQSWVDDPNSNLGVILTMNLDALTDVTFSSSDDGTIADRPILTVTTGTLVPNVTGKLYDTAVVMIGDLGFTVGEVKYEYNEEDPCVVFDQDPCSGGLVAGASIALWVSRGPQPMPDFNGDYITNLVDFNQLAGEWMNCHPDVVTTDMTADGCVQVDDLVFLVERWLQYHCKNRPEADIDGDCRVDMDDLAILLSEWLMCDDETTANLDGDGEGCVNLSDMSILSSQWGLYGEAYDQ